MMTTAEMMGSVRQMTTQDRLVVMAVSVVMDQLQRLKPEDRKDLLALLKEAASTSDRAELDAITETMLEIFECRPATIAALELSGQTKRSAALQGWNDFLAKRIREAREAAKMTQEELSTESGLPQPHISRIENAKLSPSRATLEKIAKALGKEVGYFDCINE